MTLINQQAYIITCIDSRTEPAGFLGVDLGDAIVHRVIGGRVTAGSRYWSSTKPTCWATPSWRRSGC